MEKYFKNNNFFYFKQMDIIDYPLTEVTKVRIKNFLHRVTILQDIKNKIIGITTWKVKDDDTIESIALKLYKSEHLSWAIYMANSMINPYFSWPLKENELYLFVEDKYGLSNMNDIHHYESPVPTDINDIAEGIIVDENHPGAIPISNLEYELNENDKRREIILIEPEYIGQIVQEYKEYSRKYFGVFE